jgi:hypothetical protein
MRFSSGKPVCRFKKRVACPVKTLILHLDTFIIYVYLCVAKLCGQLK